ncbi:hypothetical protein B0T16DRAFT_153917 [Cercophora newfieldiana]|uniref:Uncharacterized protein n=1 Tax=Cercophora newfieldiana TaxID=92897 RepID=A0AA39Y4Y7_9PEZI|nr:hypothetical protein B0T16DRAFT_153917 [Cercophora newfieldiana]
MLYTPNPDSPYHPSGAASVSPVGFGKVAVVTGCASGIGLAVTQLLLAHQFSVCVSAVLGLDIAEFDYNLLREADHGRFHFHRGDLTARDGEGAEEGVRICRGVFGEKIDILINVAGAMDDFSSADTLSPALWDRVLAINLTTPVLMMREVLPLMKAHNAGVIINVASTAATSGAIGGVAYTASKHGLLGATRSVAWRFRNEGIRCNAVLPGAVDTSVGKVIVEGREGRLDEEGFRQIEPVLGLQAKPSAAAPMITAMEVARAILFLVSDEARTINGVGLPVDKAWGVV